jgi:hypothetical protein
MGELVNKVLAMGESVAFDRQTTGINEHTSAHRAHTSEPALAHTPVSQRWHTLGEEGKRKWRALGHSADSRGETIEGARDQSKRSPQCMHAQKKHALVLARAIRTLSPMRHVQKNCALVLVRAILPITPLATFGCRPVLAKHLSGIVALF